MRRVITQNRIKFLIFLKVFTLYFLSLGLSGCHSGQRVGPLAPEQEKTHLGKMQNVTMKLPSGASIQVFLALRNNEQTQGLSDLQPNQFHADQGMLFYYFSAGPRRFWMPETYFDLDLFFLNENLVVTDIVRNLKAHPGRKEPPEIPTTPTIISVHVLELKSGSPAAQELQIGHQLIWPDPLSRPQIESYIHQGQ